MSFGPCKCGSFKFLDFKPMNGCLNVWQGLFDVWIYMKDGLKWNLGNSMEVKFLVRCLGDRNENF